MNVNARVRELRKDLLHLTMEEFGTRLGVGKTAISKIENAERGLTEQMLLAICREFDVNEEWLRNGVGDPFVQRSRDENIQKFFDSLTGIGSDDFKKRFVSMLSRLDTEEWRVLERMARELVESNLEYDQSDDSRPAGTPEGVAEAEAAYEEALGIVPNTGSSVSSIGAEEKKDA